MNKKSKKIFLSLFVIVFIFILILMSPIIIIGGAVFMDWLTYPGKVRAIIPEKIETRSVVTNDFSEAFGGGGDCGGLSFRLSEKTLGEIEKQGISYFENASPVAPVKYRTKIDYWRPWREAPMSSSDADNAHIPYGCVKNFENFLKKNGYRIKGDTKGYYTYVTHRGYSSLWIFPEWKIIVYSYYY